MFDKAKADHAVNFINCTEIHQRKVAGVPFELLRGRTRSSVPFMGL